ncbi:MAG: NADH-quinone oxidoreductase subunit NuoH [Dehalococcoidia bacterium]|nr:NADH-quinone oxidoreductase subunit NuoH [Dehalococcoidia bacterium]
MSRAALPPATPMARQILDHRSLLQRARTLPGEARVALALLGIMTVAALAAVGYLVIAGTLDGRWYDIRDLGNGTSHLVYWMERQGWHPAIPYLTTGLLGGLGILSLVGGWLVIGSWVERRLLAKFQIRQGPNRNGPFGLLQPIADALKLIQKEALIPIGADRLLYYLPPVLIFIPAMLGWAPVPWAARMSYVDMNVGVVYAIAISSLGVLAVFLAGWSSNNHYALLGAMRTVAMMVSYEIPISMTLLSVVVLTGSLQLSQIVAWQQQYHVWLIIVLPLAAFTFLFASTAEINRTPNDIGEAESEIVAGFHTEYSGMKAGLFLAVELGNAILVGAMMATFFLGGYTLFGLETWIPGYLILATKIGAVYFVFVWLRGTLPRFRLDQLMGFAWKFLIPLAIVQLLVVAVEALVIEQSGLPGVATVSGAILVNALLTFFGVRAWANAIGYRPEAGASTPILTTAVGGLRAAARLQAVP